MRRATALSSARSCLRAVSVQSIVQAKIRPHICSGMNRFLATAQTFKYIGGEVVILHVPYALLDDLAQVVGLAAAGGRGQQIKPALDLGIKSDGSWHDGPR